MAAPDNTGQWTHIPLESGATIGEAAREASWSLSRGLGQRHRLWAVDPGPGCGDIGNMSRTVNCVKLSREAEGLEKPPFKGPLGQRIFEQVSAMAWRQWLEHSKMLINEFRLDLTSEPGQRIWMTECEKYFFGDGSALPPEFVPGPH